MDDVQLWLVPAEELNSSKGDGRGALDEEKSGGYRGRRESALDVGEAPGEAGGPGEERLAGKGAGRRKNPDAAEARSRWTGMKRVEKQHGQ